MDLMIILGTLLTVAALYWGAPDIRLQHAAYLDMDSFILVLFGALGAVIVSSSYQDLENIFRLLKKLLLKKRSLNPAQAVTLLVEVSEKAQFVSKQELVDFVHGKEDGFLEKALALGAAGLDKDFVQKTLENDIKERYQRHSQLIDKMSSMASYAPMFGMAGTVIGVVHVLKDVNDIDNVLTGLSLALLTTLYGLFLSAVIFLPLANRLKRISEQEMLTKIIITEGVLAIMDREIPLKVERYLQSFLDSKMYSDVIKKK